jgi:aspartyl-tRNA(Asn)/glutamyl-tRNA(Gln) amidotransferase subunit A
MSRRVFVKSALAGAAGSVLLKSAAARPAAGAPTALSLTEAAQLVRRKKISPVELTHACLDRIEKLNPSLNAFITVTAESALASARSAEAEIGRDGWKGPLHGIPIALKDLLDTAGVPTTAGSALFKERIPQQDAEVVRRLKAAGAVLLGKLNMHEFAYGGSSAFSHFGPVHNPWNLAYSPGGSSGGSAAAVAAQLCYAALGSDTGGSIREPAAYCGIVGLKPTYGRVSTSGAIPLSWSLDHLGPMTRTVSDAALLLQVIAGYDPHDSGSTDVPVPDYAAGIDGATAALRLGIPRNYFYENLHPDIQAAVQAALDVLKKLTRTQRDVPPLAADASYASVMDPYVAILTAEAYEFHKDSVAKSPELYQAATLKRIRAGADVTLSTYMQSRRRLDQARHAAARFFADVDLLITPTAAVPPFALSELGDPGTARPLELRMLHNTRPLNLLGLPAISVPCGFTAAHLPIGVQITGPPGGEAMVLRLARAYERATAWHQSGPVMSAG